MKIDVKKSKRTVKKRRLSDLNDPVCVAIRTSKTKSITSRTRSKIKVIDGVVWMPQAGRIDCATFIELEDDVQDVMTELKEDAQDVMSELKEDVQDVTSMLASIDTTFSEEEDDALVKYEQGTWECPKCQHSNRNDSSYCKTIVGEGIKMCLGTPRCEQMLTWGNCFAQSPRTWICSMCTSPNPFDKVNCLVCTEPRKNGSPIETASSKPVLSGGRISTDGFKFGSTFVPSGGANSNLLPTGIGSGGFTFTGGSAKQSDSKE